MKVWLTLLAVSFAHSSASNDTSASAGGGHGVEPLLNRSRFSADGARSGRLTLAAANSTSRSDGSAAVLHSDLTGRPRGSEVSKGKQAAVPHPEDDDLPVTQQDSGLRRGRKKRASAGLRARGHGKGKALNPMDRLSDEVERIPTEVQDAPSRSESTYKSFRRTFFPGVMHNPSLVWISVALVALVSLWFVLYFGFVYSADREDDLGCMGNEMDPGSPGHQARLRRLRDTGAKLFSRLGRTDPSATDIIMVFHHPKHFYDDGPEAVEGKQLDQYFIVQKSGAWLGNTPFETLLMEREKPTTTKNEARIAVLTDMCTFLPELGFEVTPFCSIDGDEIFLRVSLRKEATIRYHMKRVRWWCQLNPRFVERMGVDQPAEEPASSPPYVPYSAKVCDRLKQAGFADITIQDVYRDLGEPGKPSLAGSVDRIRLIMDQITEHFDIDAAVENGLLVGYYPVHEQRKMEMLREVWGRMALVLDMSFYQPLQAMRAYFGSRVTFFMAWTGLYCKALCGLLVPAILVTVLMWSDWYVSGGGVVLAASQVAFGVLIILWAAVAFRLYQQQQGFLLADWDWNKRQSVGRDRPAFQGEFVPSDLNARIMMRRASPTKLTISRTASRLIVASMCLLSLAIFYVWSTVFQVSVTAQDLNITAYVVLGILIKVLDLIYTPILLMLNEFENYRTEPDFNNALIWKTFSIQSITYYFPFLYLVVVQRHTTAGCPSVMGLGSATADCVMSLQIELVATLLTLTVFRLLEVAWQVWHIQHNLEEEIARVRLEDESLHRHPMEEESKFYSFEERDFLEMQLQLVISLGFILLFGAVAPITVIFSFVLFVVQLRATAWLMTHVARRPLPRASKGIGPWRELVFGLMVVGIFVSGFAVAIHGEVLEGAPLLARLSFVLLWCSAGFVALGVVTYSMPDEDQETTLLNRRRAYVEAEFGARQDEGELKISLNTPTPPQRGFGGKKGLARCLSMVVDLKRAEHYEAVLSHDWDSIPKMPAKKRE